MTLDLCCPVAAYGHATVPFAGFDEWRKTNCQKRQSTAFAQTCKLGDEQTMVAAEAMFRAIDSAGWSGRSLEEWGIVAAPQFLGRLRMWSAIERYRAGSSRGVAATYSHGVAARGRWYFERHFSMPRAMFWGRWIPGFAIGRIYQRVQSRGRWHGARLLARHFAVVP